MIGFSPLVYSEMFAYLFRATAAVLRSERIADQRWPPSVFTAALWADFQAGASFSICFRRLLVMDNSTGLPCPPPAACANPYRCKGRRFRTRVVGSIPKNSLNSAILHLS